MKKIKMRNEGENTTIRQGFELFVVSQKAKGVAEKTVETYYNHFHCVSKHWNVDMFFEDLTRKDLDAMIVSMRESGLAHNSIGSYLRVVKTFLNWAKREGYTSLNVPNYKQEETVKETYTDEELKALLARPAPDCQFCEYRNWVIINFLMNCGCRAATIRNIQNQDVFLTDGRVVFRHTKNHKIQTIPLCSKMVNILRAYMKIRGGSGADYLFCDEYGNMLTENGLRLAIAHFNHSRGVKKTSIHLFRHTFARKYLIDCHGNAFMLQKLLGHSTLKMTRHYCAIYDADITKEFDRISPLSQFNLTEEKIRKRA